VELLKGLLWSDSTEVLYRTIAGAKLLCSDFHFTMQIAPGYAGECGFISFDAKGRVTVKAGYVWDGASGPTIDTPDSVCAALGHDCMYELMGRSLLPVYVYKNVADLWFYDRLRLDGMVDFRAWYWYKAVYVFGVPGMSKYDQIKRAPIPFPVVGAPSFSPLPGHLIPS
jgi:hypothetical protein